MRFSFFLIFVIFIFNPCFSQEESYSIQGKLAHGGGEIKMYKNKSIQLFHGSALISETKSDSVGLFEFQNLKALDYTIHIDYFQIDSLISYNRYDSDSRVWFFLPRICDISREIALQEIESGRPRLILAGGISPSIVFGQEKFEKKFKVEYYDFGCQPPDRKCIEAHNKCVAKYLDMRYGKRWRKQVRKDVPFLNYK